MEISGALPITEGMGLPVPAPVPFSCPRCGAARAEVDVECLRCGVIFAKLERPALSGPTLAPVPPAPRPAEALDDDPLSSATRTLRGALLAGLVVWTLRLGAHAVQSNVVGSSFLHLINLVFHEAGHMLFLPFGRFMTVLGGSLNQVLIPLVCTLALLRHRDRFGACVTVWWMGENLLDLAPYINDARNLQLVLLGGYTGAQVEGHDWEYLLQTLGLLHWDHRLATVAHATGVAIMLAAIVAGAVVWRQERGADARQLGT